MELLYHSPVVMMQYENPCSIVSYLSFLNACNYSIGWIFKICCWLLYHKQFISNCPFSILLETNQFKCLKNKHLSLGLYVSWNTGKHSLRKPYHILQCQQRLWCISYFCFICYFLSKVCFYCSFQLEYGNKWFLWITKFFEYAIIIGGYILRRIRFFWFLWGHISA